MIDGKIPTKDDIKSKGMVFTPIELVNQMLDKIPQEVLLNPEKTVGDISGCGTGNFLVEVLNRRMTAGINHYDSLKTIYGIDIDRDNIEICKKRLSLDSQDPDILFIIDLNIICADALDELDPSWDKVGYMWSNVEQFKRVMDGLGLQLKDFKNFVCVDSLIERNSKRELRTLENIKGRKTPDQRQKIKDLKQFIDSNSLKNKTITL